MQSDYTIVATPRSLQGINDLPQINLLTIVYTVLDSVLKGI